MLGELTSTSSLQFRVNDSTAGHTISWQVIEFADPADINVQKGSTSLTGSTTSVDVTLGTSVDVTKTFILAGYRIADDGPDVGARMIRARLLNSNTIRIDRGVGGDNISEIVWQAVELKDGATVQGGTEHFSTGSSNETTYLSSVVDTSRSIAFASVQPAGGQNMGKSNYTGDDIIGVGSVTMDLSSDHITMQRSNTDGSADIGWFVVEFAQPCTAPSTPRANILFVVPNASSLSISDAAKRCAMYAWNLDVTLISESATSGQFDTAIASANAVYVSSTVSASAVGSKLADKNIGIASEVPGLDDDFKLTNTGGSTTSSTAIDVTSDCHYITSSFGTGSLTILDWNQLLATASTTLATDAVTLAERVGSSSPILVVEERRNKLYDDSRSTGRRVHMPWGGSSFNFNALNSNGQLLMRRAIEWAAEVDGTLGIWRFDETSGTTATDVSGNGHTATLTSMDPATDWCKGRVDNALDFDGINDRAVTSGTFTPPTAGTVAFFMQVPGPPATHGRIFGVGGNFEVRHVNSGNPDGIPYGLVFDLCVENSNPDFITTVPIDQPGRWYHAAATYNQPAGTYSVYLDGVLHTSGTRTLTMESPGTLTIGTRTGATEYYTGKIDDLRIYDRELCADEIAALARQRTLELISQWREVRNKP